MVIVLTYAWAPTIAWCAAVIGSTASALGAVGLVREVMADNGGTPVPALGALVVVALLVPPAIAAAYATHDGRRPRAVVAIAWLLAIGLGSLLVGNFLVRTLGGERGGVPEWAWLGVIGALLAMGLVRDLRPAITRTRARVAAGEAAGRRRGRPVRGRALGHADVRGRAGPGTRGRPGRGRRGRARPARRRPPRGGAAVPAAGPRRRPRTGGTVERLAADLRAAVDEVESLLVARRSIVLEEMGLLAGVEWLAERVEDRSDVRVEIEVGAADALGGRPPRDVERAAFRVAQLALDNVVRHAPGCTARVAVTASATAVRLRIAGRRRRPGCRRARRRAWGPARDLGHAGGGARVRRRARDRARRGRPGHGRGAALARLRDGWPA